MADRSRDWLAQAHRDVDHARWSLEGGFNEWACFAAQQAAEKAVKAVYQHLSGAAWGHSVAELLLGLRERTDVPDEMVGLGRLLDRFYVPARYPNGWESGSPHDYFSKEDVDGAIRAADELIRFCEGLLAR
jgi:HEPN domain-containing protein